MDSFRRNKNSIRYWLIVIDIKMLINILKRNGRNINQYLNWTYAKSNSSWTPFFMTSIRCKAAFIAARCSDALMA
jgi:hypothetical protein